MRTRSSPRTCDRSRQNATREELSSKPKSKNVTTVGGFNPYPATRTCSTAMMDSVATPCKHNHMTSRGGVCRSDMSARSSVCVYMSHSIPFVTVMVVSKPFSPFSCFVPFPTLDQDPSSLSVRDVVSSSRLIFLSHFQAYPTPRVYLIFP